MAGEAGQPPSSRNLDRALPQIFVDAMKNGLPTRDASDKRKVWAMVMRIAMSAHVRGWTEAQFVTEMTKCEKHKTRREHHLWVQLQRGSSDRAACKALPHRVLPMLDRLAGPDRPTAAAV